MSAEPEFYTREDLAALLKVGLRVIEKWTQARRIPGQVKVGRLWRYRILEVQKRLLSGEFLLPSLKEKRNAYLEERRKGRVHL